MAKLYLIRRNMESFAGPMTLVEMKDAYKRMAFGLQDEVSGHCGPWVGFDDLAKIKKVYPDVAKVVHEDMLAGWGVSEHGARVSNAALRTETRRLPDKNVSTRRHLGLALVFLVVALVAFAAAIYLAVPMHLGGKVTDEQASPATPDIEQAQAYLNTGNIDGFKQFMLEAQPSILPQLPKSKKMLNDWIPYLRVQAFIVPSSGGEIPGIAPKILRGGSANAAPVDCSEKIWKKRFRISSKQWSSLVLNRRIARLHWARLLAWDPHWIYRRSQKGWIAPRNYYVGCLMMADRALASIALEGATSTTVVAVPSSGQSAGGAGLSDLELDQLEKMRTRVQWILEISRDGHSSLQPVAKVDDALSQWSCFEAAKDLKELNRCRDAVASTVEMGDGWATYNEERYNWNVLRLLIDQRGSLNAELAAMIPILAAKLNKADFLTRFDYRVEQKLAKLIADRSSDKSLDKSQGKSGAKQADKTLDKNPERAVAKAIDKSLDKLGSEFPDVKLSH